MNLIKNKIEIWYPFDFYGKCTFALIAQDSAYNRATIILDFKVIKWKQYECNKCTGEEIYDCIQWNSNSILNLKNGVCISFLTIDSIRTLKWIGIIAFIMLIIFIFPVSKFLYLIN